MLMNKLLKVINLFQNTKNIWAKLENEYLED